MSATCRPRPLWPYIAGVAGFAASVQLGAGNATLAQLGMPTWAVSVLLLLAVACRSLKLRLYLMKDGRQRLRRFPESVQQAVLRWRAPFAEQTAVTLNVGGAIVPLGFSIYALDCNPISPPQLLLASFVVAGVIEIGRRLSLRHAVAFPLVLVAPATALLLGWALSVEHRAVFIYVSGLAGILAGADLLHLHDLRNIGTPEVVIGGDATFDAVFVNQLFSLLFG